MAGSSRDYSSFDTEYMGITSYEKRNSGLPVLEMLQGRTSGKSATRQLSNTKYVEDSSTKRTRRKPRNKLSKEAPDSAKKASQLNLESSSHTSKFSSSKSPPQTLSLTKQKQFKEVSRSNLEYLLNTPKPFSSKSPPQNLSLTKQKQLMETSRSNLESLPNTPKPSTSKLPPQIQNSTKLKHLPESSQVKVKFSCSIQPVLNATTGYFLRRRNSKYKYVNIKSFVGSTKKIPCVFVSDLPAYVDLVNKCESLSIYDKKDMTKSQLRKFLKNSQQDEANQLEASSSTPKPPRKRRREKSKKPEPKFEDYIQVEEVAEGLKSGELIKGVVRINPKNFKDAYVSNANTSLADYYLTSVVDRNRALEGDEVILRIKPESQWVDGKKTARVVYISDSVHKGRCIGTMRPIEKNNEFAMFYPRDKRIPFLRIPAISWPLDFKTNPKQYEKILYVAKIVEWKVPPYAIGALEEKLGSSGNLVAESLSILREYHLDIQPFDSKMDIYLPESDEIPAKELEYREDIRKHCVFTIDPATARDLDDAVSVRELPNGNYEVGVHISDAAFYLKEGTELDEKVSKKATTVYMVEKAYHMLPVELCLFCSLLPGQDRLSFSVFWEITPDCNILSKRFGRTILNSCAQLAYEHAQEVIENPDKDFKDEDFPTIHNGFTLNDLKKTITVLQTIAVQLRERRVQNGALKIDQVKLAFSLDPIKGEPMTFWKYENKESHRLIEEFMLLANISVAERISEYYPDIAFLRCHEPPKQTMLVELQNNLATCGIHIDISSSAGIDASMKKYITNDYPGLCRAAVLNHITAKAMTRARYFCSSTMQSELDYKHYALSIPIYTHFTSPIRRYADIMVHRLLAATLDYQEKPKWDVDYVSKIAANCNAQKYNAKRAGEASCDLYLAHYIEKHQPFIQDCVVVDVKEKSFDVIVLTTGSIIRIYQNNCEEGIKWKTEAIPHTTKQMKEKMESEKKLYRLTVTFPRTQTLKQSKLIIEMFTAVKVNLKRKDSYKLEGTLLRP